MILRPFLLAASLAAVALPVAAQETAPVTTSAKATAGQSPDPLAKKLDDRNCLRSTGSMIRPRKGDCTAAIGRVWSREDLERTGRIDVVDALRALDPAIR